MKKIISLSFLFVFALNSCNNDDNISLQPENTIENTIKGKWFYYAEEELDEHGNIDAFWDLTEKECNSGFIVFQDNNVKLEEHADLDEDCEKYEIPGVWQYDKVTNTLTIVDEEDDYIVKGTLINVNTQELRIKLIQQGDDTDLEDWNTHLVFKKAL